MKRLVALLLLGGTAYAGGSGSADSAGKTAFALGMTCLTSDDFPCAEQKFVEAIAADATYAPPYPRLASIYYKNKKYKDAVALLHRAPATGEPNDLLDIKEQLGLALYKTVSPPPAEAIKLLEEVVAQSPVSFAAQLQLGQHFLKIDPKRAAVALEGYLKSRPANLVTTDEQIHNLLGTAYLLAKEWDLAQNEFQGLLKTKPNEVAYKLGLGTAYVAKEECSKAISLYEGILGKAPQQPSIYYNLGKCYLKVNRATDAEREATLYIKSKGTDIKGYVLLGDAQFAQNQYAKALGAYQGAANIDKNNTSVVSKIGKTDVKLKNYDAAISELERAEATSPNDVDILCAEIEAYAAKKNNAKLEAKAGKLAPMTKDAQALACAAKAYYENGNDEKAMVTLQSSMALDPNSGETKSTLVKVYNRQAGKHVDKGEFAKAQMLLVDAEKLQGDNVQTNRNLGLVYVLAKKCAEAELPLSKALKKSPNDIVSNRLMGRALSCQSKRKDARTAYEKAALVALKTRGQDLANVYTELGPIYVEDHVLPTDGLLDQAVTVLETAVKEAGPSQVGQVAMRNLSSAYLKRAQERMRDKQWEPALEDIVKAENSPPKGILTNKELAGIACLEWQAAQAANKTQQAEEATARAKTLAPSIPGGCALKPPFDKLWQLPEAYSKYRDGQSPAKREEAAKLLQAMSQKNPTIEWLKQLLRSDFELLAFDYWQRSDEKKAEASLRSAGKVVVKGGDKRDWEHNLGVMDLFYGRLPQAEKAFDALNGKPGEALINLGIIKDKAGDGKAALGLYRQAQAKGARGPRLKEWIDVKQRIYGGVP